MVIASKTASEQPLFDVPELNPHPVHIELPRLEVIRFLEFQQVVFEMNFKMRCHFFVYAQIKPIRSFVSHGISTGRILYELQNTLS